MGWSAARANAKPALRKRSGVLVKAPRGAVPPAVAREEAGREETKKRDTRKTVCTRWACRINLGHRAEGGGGSWSSSRIRRRPSRRTGRNVPNKNKLGDATEQVGRTHGGCGHGLLPPSHDTQASPWSRPRVCFERKACFGFHFLMESPPFFLILVPLAVLRDTVWWTSWYAHLDPDSLLCAAPRDEHSGQILASSRGCCAAAGPAVPADAVTDTHMHGALGCKVALSSGRARIKLSLSRSTAPTRRQMCLTLV